MSPGIYISRNISKLSKKIYETEIIIKCDANECIDINNNSNCSSDSDKGNISYENNSLNICINPNADSSKSVWKNYSLVDGNRYLLPKDIAKILFKYDKQILMKTTKSSIEYVESKFQKKIVKQK